MKEKTKNIIAIIITVGLYVLLILVAVYINRVISWISRLGI